MLDMKAENQFDSVLPMNACLAQEKSEDQIRQLLFGFESAESVGDMKVLQNLLSPMQ
jgi:hypothetical protein